MTMSTIKIVVTSILIDNIIDGTVLECFRIFRFVVGDDFSFDVFIRWLFLLMIVVVIMLLMLMFVQINVVFIVFCSAIFVA